MTFKKLLGAAMCVAGGYMFWKRGRAHDAITAAVAAPLTAPETEPFMPITFKRGEGCPR